MERPKTLRNPVPMSRRGAIGTIGVGAATAAIGAPGKALTSSVDLTWLPAWKLRALIVDRQISAVAVTEHFLERIAKLDPKLNMFRRVDAAGALDQARAADKLLAEGGKPGPLHGVPTAIKEHVAVRGMPTLNAMEGKADAPPAQRDSIVVERLRRAGAIIVGITIMPGLGTGPGIPDLAHHPRNPWNLDHVPGGSSAGSSAAVASGCLPFAVGSDGGGSTRLPAAYTGVIGLHPTMGRTPDVDLQNRRLNYFGTIGPLTRDVRDAALVMEVIASPDGRAMTSTLHGPAPDYLSGLDAGVRGLRVQWMDDLGYAKQYATDQSPRVVSAVRRAATGISELGAKLTTGQGTWSDPRRYSSMLNGVYSGTPLPAPPSDEQFIEALEMREKLRADFTALLTRYDILALPTAQVTAPAVVDWDANWRNDMIRYSQAYTPNTLIFNFLMMPAISIPCGFVDGLPIGLQLVGLPDSEPQLLKLANAFLMRFPQNSRPANT